MTTIRVVDRLLCSSPQTELTAKKSIIRGWEFNKIVTPFALVGYEIGNSWLFIISNLTRAHGVNVRVHIYIIAQLFVERRIQQHVISAKLKKK